MRRCVYRFFDSADESRGERDLGELEAGVAGDGVAQLLSQRALLLIVGQLEQVETRGRGGQSVLRIFLANREETSDHATCEGKNSQ